jgi:hypothetical protein
MAVRMRWSPSLLFVLGGVLAACAPNRAPVPLETFVGSSTATVHKRIFRLPSGLCSNQNPDAPDVTAWWNGLPPANRRYPFAGFEVWGGMGGCQQSLADVYRAVVTFNMAGVSNLRGLVQRADLIVETRAMPDSVGRVVSIGPLGTTSQVNASCPTLLGGGGQLHRIPPAAAGSLPPVQGIGILHQLADTDPLPGGQVMYTIPQQFTAGPITGATNPTSLGPNGSGGSAFVTDVTNSVNAALNGNFAGMSYVITSNFEGPVNFAVPEGHNVECKTSYDVRLRLTHY